MFLKYKIKLNMQYLSNKINILLNVKDIYEIKLLKN